MSDTAAAGALQMMAGEVYHSKVNNFNKLFENYAKSGTIHFNLSAWYLECCFIIQS